MKKFEVGQQVLFLHESGGGIVRGIDTKGNYIVEDELGFNRIRKEDELTSVFGNNYDTRSEFQKNASGENISVGMEVKYLREKGRGVVKEIRKKGYIIVADESGFDREMFIQDVAPVINDDIPIIEMPDTKDLVTKNKSVNNSDQKTGRHKVDDIWTIDLHSHVLFESHVGLSNHEILMKQLSTFKSFFQKVIDSNVRKFIVIHGVGQGVLKEEVRSFLSGKTGIEYYDADYIKYGRGATEVRIRYKG